MTSVGLKNEHDLHGDDCLRNEIDDDVVKMMKLMVPGDDVMIEPFWLIILCL